jgi:hypothetical protein
LGIFSWNCNRSAAKRDILSSLVVCEIMFDFSHAVRPLSEVTRLNHGCCKFDIYIFMFRRGGQASLTFRIKPTNVRCPALSSPKRVRSNNWIFKNLFTPFLGEVAELEGLLFASHYSCRLTSWQEPFSFSLPLPELLGGRVRCELKCGEGKLGVKSDRRH